ncbi:sulfatase-like hydrolase/transferase [Haloferula chungangensis]|uniref:Sulfatase-like hydrolase/transferase n=1 Tax=Haloferula chungangensis TaxID=1048331 RepID=A0ABW2L4H2_9BACT
MKSVKIIYPVVLLLLRLQTAHATDIAHEDFDYPAGAALNSQNGGAGWSGAWAAPAGVTVANPAADLTYPNLPTNGNSLSNPVGGNVQGITRGWNASGFTDDGDEVWFSLMVNATPGDSNGDEFRFQLFQGGGDAVIRNNGSDTMLVINELGGVELWGMSGTSANGTTTVSTGANHLIVGQYVFSDTAGSDVWKLWIDPDVTVALGGANLTATGDIKYDGGAALASENMDMRFLRAGMKVDELRIGTTAADVGVQPPSPPSPRPNILWITSEDNGRFLGCYGDPVARTPNLDTLASTGVRFTSAFSNGAVCAVARNCWLTGVPSVARGNTPMRSRYRIPQQFTADYYPKRLSAAGYYVTNDNKDDFNIALSQVNPAEVWNDMGPNAHYKNRPTADTPFFCIINIGTTHEGQISSTQSAFNNGDALPTQSAINAVQPPYEMKTTASLSDWQQMYADLEDMDDEVGALVAELTTRGVADNTIVVYCSDHGGVLTRSKRYLYDSGTRVPMIVYVPPALQHLAPAITGTDADGAYTDRLVEFLDMPYTWLTLAGVTPPAEMTGTAFMGETPGPAPATAFLFMDRADEAINLVRGVTDGQYKYIRNYNPDRPIFKFNEFSLSRQPGQEGQWHEYAKGNTSPEHSALFEQRPSEELYDTNADPHEVNNLAANPAYASTLSSMRSALDGHMLANRDTGLIPEPMMEVIDGSGSDTIHSWAQSNGNFPIATILPLANAASMRNPANLPLFVSAVQDPNVLIRYWGAMGLRMLGRNARPAIAAVETALADPDPNVRLAAAVALARLGQRDRALNNYIIPELTNGASHLELAALDAMTLLNANEEFLALPAGDRPTGDVQTRLGERLLFGGSAYNQKLVQYTADDFYPGGELYPDHDGDGVVSYTEYLAHRNPHDASDYGFEFQTNDNFEGWTVSGVTGQQVNGGKLSGTSSSGSAYLQRAQLFFGSGEFSHLLLRINASANGTCKLRWITDQDGTYDITKEVTATYTSAGSDQLISFDCAADSDWSDSITGMRIYPSDLSGASFQLEWVIASSGDQDGDGQADGAEGLNDPDGDALENLRDPDSDGNGLPDNIEVENGLDPYVLEANIDTDGDGVLDFDEMIAGTSIFDPSEFWKLQIRDERENKVLSFPTVSGRSYLLEVSYDLDTWFPLEDFLADTSETTELTDPLPAPGGSGFYRAHAK